MSFHPASIPLLTVSLTFATLLGGCGVETSSNTRPPRIPEKVDRLADWLSGSFENATQADADPAFARLSLNSCRVWPDRTDGRWIYLEEAPADDLDRPTRREMRRIRIDDQATLVSEVFAFPTGSTPPAGSWRHPENLDAVDPFLLLPNEGCTIHLTGTGDAFRGETRGRGCQAPGRDATYVTSDVVISAAEISFWERGFNDLGDHVSGSEKGPILFERRTDS